MSYNVYRRYVYHRRQTFSTPVSLSMFARGGGVVLGTASISIIGFVLILFHRSRTVEGDTDRPDVPIHAGL